MSIRQPPGDCAPMRRRAAGSVRVRSGPFGSRMARRGASAPVAAVLPAGRTGQAPVQALSLARRNRSALATTLSEDNAIAADAITGDSNTPNNGYRTPAAIGIPAAL